MNRAMYAAASGMAAEQASLDAVTENLSHADVTAFKAEFAHHVALGNRDGEAGVAVDGTRTMFTQGKIAPSGGPCDIAIDGEGFFPIQRGNDIAYTRDGSFTRDAKGMLANADGWHLAGLHVPARAQALHIESDGRVRAEVGGNTQLLGRIRLAVFAAPERLYPVSATCYAATHGSGTAVYVAPNTDRGPKLAFGALERSNVSIVDSMMEIMKAQRAYEADAKGVQAAE